ncbi:MAG: type II toxin-antitoxin system HicB family antitoxin [bacterium]
MNSSTTMVYWKGDRFWLGKLKEHPQIMTQARTLKELEENLRDAYRMLVLADVPEDHREKAIAL